MIPPRLDEGSEREAFEAWLVTQGWKRIPHLNRSVVSGKYAWSALNDAWGVWQARAALSTGRLGGEAEGINEALSKKTAQVDVRAILEVQGIYLSTATINKIIDAALLAAPAAQSQGASNE